VVVAHPGKEHVWGRALTSSQCFGVNPFAPLALDRALARLVLRTLLPARRLAAADAVKVALEYTPQDGPGWLGERPQQPTQVDAAFIVWRDERSVGYLLVEVKLRERGFGACRGAARPSAGAHGNPHPDRRRSLAQIMAEPQRHCWLVETERRRYWRYICDESGLFRFDRLDSGAACPFSGGLYQLMRNRVLAHALVREGGADWTDVSLCIHPANDAVDALDEAVGGAFSAQAAFRSLLRSKDGLLNLPPQALIDAVVTASPRLGDWAEWLHDRYQL